MSLRDADIKSTYFLNEISPYFFYNELYLHATEITIALGYFTKTAFCIGTEALLHFIKENNGKIHIICNEKILVEDTEAISCGYNLKEKESVSLSDFEDLIKTKDVNSFQVFSYKCLAYLIAMGRLDIQIANSNRLVHFKIGYAIDDEGNTVAFSGSVNYTLSALLYNWEQLTTYCSWENPDAFQSRIDEIVNPINKLLNGDIKGLPLIEGKKIEQFIKENYPVQDLAELEKDADLAKQKVKIRVGKKEIKLLEEDSFPTIFSIPPTLSPRPHQQKALKNFFYNDCKTLFAMATGTGKTLTSLFAVNDLSFDIEIQSVLILVPLQNLVEQWEKDVKKMYSGEIIKISSEYSDWKNQLQDYSVGRIVRPDRRVVIITTYDSYLLNFEKILGSLCLGKTVVIADEVHTFGATRKQLAMPAGIQYRIGLSATPKRAYDDSGTKAVFDFFCPSNDPFVFSLNDAIESGFLCKYNYYPELVHLTDEEYSDYVDLTEKIKRLSSFSMNDSDDEKNEQIKLLAKQRHRLIENAENKADAIRDYFARNINSKDFSKTIVFCPEGKSSDDDQNIDLIQRVIWDVFKRNGKKIKMNKYIQGTPISVLEDFSSGFLDMILAKKRLNEGIDIPTTQRALFVSSSTSEREFIQRRGRILRLSEGKTMAEIVDFLVVPPIDSPEGGTLFKQEMSRFLDFANTAQNSNEALMVLNQYIGSV